MRKCVFVWVILAGLLAGCGTGSETATQSVPPPDESFSVLDPYGVWMDIAGLGRVWQPAVSYDWRPFGDGQWVWTDRGWMWLSDEPFGWIVYHYGSWAYWGAAGWLWVPGYEWSPARVRWYAGEDFVGWAPMPPPGVSFPQGNAQENMWMVVPANQFTREHVGRYRESAQPRVLVPGREQQHAPDVRLIQRVTNQELRRRTTESEDIRRGQRTLTRVRVKEETPPAPVAPPPQITTPPPAGAPSPGTRQGEVRRSGNTRTPDTTARTPGATTRTPRATPKTPGATTTTPGTQSRTPGATTRTPGTTRPNPAPPKTPAPANAEPRKAQRPASGESVRTPQKPDSTGTSQPRR
jgi:hypothetical protein